MSSKSIFLELKIPIIQLCSESIKALKTKKIPGSCLRGNEFFEVSNCVLWIALDPHFFAKSVINNHLDHILSKTPKISELSKFLYSPNMTCLDTAIFYWNSSNERRGAKKLHKVSAGDL